MGLLFFYTIVSFINYGNAGEWFEKKSTHFIIYYKEDRSSDYLNAVVSATESYYTAILNSLGFYRFDFWTWDNRCKIFLYVSRDNYYNEKRYRDDRISIAKRLVEKNLFIPIRELNKIKLKGGSERCKN
ncbi:MAG: hypothetical protein ABH836_08005 [Candidatus Omnitrophota bacterium]